MSLNEYYAPTRVVFGKDAEKKAGELALWLKSKKVLLHYGEGSAKASGVLDRVASSLDDVGIEYIKLGGVKPNPLLSLVYKGIEMGRAAGVDLVLAIGGGSAIDSAKAIAYGLANDFDVWDLFTGKKNPVACVNNACVLTIAAAGSEMSNSCVITKDEGKLKYSCNHDVSRCKFALLNPELTYTLPQYQTLSGCADILMHTIERYFGNNDTLDLTDGIASTLLKTVMKNALILMDEPKNYKARSEIMWAGSLSHNGLTNFGGPRGDFATHKLEHELSALFDVAHGAGLCALWASWARYVMDENIARFEKFAIEVMGVPPANTQRATALDGIKAMEQFFKRITMPTSIGELGIDATDETIELLAERCSQGGTKVIGLFKLLKKEDMASIYKKAK